MRHPSRSPNRIEALLTVVATIGLSALPAIAAGAAGPSTQPAAATGPQFNARITGVVTDSEGNPLEGATVRIVLVVQDPTRPTPPVETTTDESGRYYARDVSIQSAVRISIECEGFKPFVDERQLRGGANRIDVTLEKVEVSTEVIQAQAANDAYQAGLVAYEERRFEDAVARMHEAMTAVETLEDTAEALIYIYTLLGRSHVELRQWDQAVDAFQSWAELAPDDAAPHLALAEVYGYQGESDLASQEFEKALALDPNDAGSLYNVGVTKVNAGMVEEGIELLLRAIELQPQYPLAHKNLGYAYARIEQYQKAIEHFEAFLEQAPDDPEAPQIRDFIVALKEMIGA